ncbi:MAG: HAD hydrolase-like protein [Ferrimicrobium sp.]|jgi:phosphonatase-like hydrolase|nr:HAD hydrolase-like protein [Ferrimicrobium sp.]
MSVTNHYLDDVELVCFDMAGTTVLDSGRVLDAFDRAIIEITHRQPTHDERNFVVHTMGQSKIEVFTALLHDESMALQATEAFERHYEEAVQTSGVDEMQGAANLFAQLRKADIRVFLTTGFSATTQELLIDTLGWRSLIDGALCPTESLRGRPHPDMVLAAALAARVTSMAKVASVGDTTMDALSGKNAGAGSVIGVLTGGFTEQALLRAGATTVVASIADLTLTQE